MQVVIFSIIALIIASTSNSTADTQHSIGISGAFTKTWTQDYVVSPLYYSGDCKKWGLIYEITSNKNQLYFDASYKYGDLYSGISIDKIPVADCKIIAGGIALKRIIVAFEKKMYLKIATGMYVDNMYYYNIYTMNKRITIDGKYPGYDQFMNITAANVYMSILTGLKKHALQLNCYFPIVSYVVRSRQVEDCVYFDDQYLSLFNQTWQFNYSVSYIFSMCRYLDIVTCYKFDYLRCDVNKRIKITTDEAEFNFVINLFRKKGPHETK